MSELLKSVAAATDLFAREARGCARVEVKVASGDGMPLLCAVEAALRRGLDGPFAQELVWLSGGAAGHHLVLKAYGPENKLMAEAAHAFA
jgi:hypothetical protein